MIEPSDEELRRLLAGGESDRVEFKRSLDGDVPRKLRETVCAFANDLGGTGRPGVVFVGVDDRGAPVGAAIDDRMLLNLAALRTEGTVVPPPSTAVFKRVLDGRDVAILVVAPSDAPPVSYMGRIHVRCGPRNGVATRQDERILNERRRFGDRPFDARPVRGAALSDLDRRIFEDEYLPKAVDADTLAQNGRTFEERLAAAKMIASVDDPTPTVLGLLILGRRPLDLLPCAYVQFLRVAGRDLSDPIADEGSFDGPLAEMLHRLEGKLATHVVTSVDLVSGPLESRRANLPLSALRQILRNAVMHRTYEATNAPVRVTWFDDRVEILSPGGPFGAVTAESFGRPGVCDYRNPSLAEAMKVLGFVQRFGVGLATARREMEANGNPAPEFRVEGGHVLAVLRSRA